jgi:hypothetical protein
MANKELDNEVKRQINSTEKDIENFVLRLDKFLSTNARKILKQIKTGKDSGLATAKALGALETELYNAGLGDYFVELENIYVNEYKSIRKTFEIATNRKLVLNDVDLDVAESLINFKADIVQGKVTQYIYNINDAVLSSVFGGETPDIDQVLETYGSRTASNIQSEINTGVAGFNRTVTFKKAQDLGLDKFVYLGPLDKITRPFCRKVVGKVFTINEIKAMDNGQGLDVMTYGGGYNCRHQWRPVSDELAKEYQNEK